MNAIYSFCGGSQPSRPTLNTEPVWMLGVRYQRKEGATDDERQSLVEQQEAAFPEFVEDFRSRLYITYRKDFPAIHDTFYTSDMGWGCMMRSGQMMFGQALLTHFLGRGFRKKPGSAPQEYFSVLKLFADSPAAPFSIHNLAQMGLETGKQIGEWFTPSDISVALRKLSERFLKNQIAVYVSDDGMVYRDEVQALGCAGAGAPAAAADGGKAEAAEDGEWNQSVVILIPLRLGLGNLNEIYSACIQQLFRFPQSLGIAGGKPKASLYFVASQGEKLFYLDPHQVAPTVDMSRVPFDTSSYHCNAIHMLSVKELDPSLTIGFYCRNSRDFDAFCDSAKEAESQMGGTHLFGIAQTRPQYGSSDVSWPESEHFITEDDFVSI
mmetsp:Transcript_7475/g.31655  ORF Transcript_7475/g.31655 Transcript_7475/m.31655 type:complete len:380 (+) Transcript_7475:594-1733(+)|eukprot:CAMPEP_0114628980 /NCGR_PEP_ID=MMETSP0168-20121206/13114_1 /TAXON_ID=95228 ORGANISM="Vannella sp., Strain DIVA3 517/6/12" /NCGR_SAMPLE_ID=MMETSP0168 /ASSEMBLY_ACC=CAM_ASM_000044 /LENGTH=379 /DNA_ID=CAMNT_0001840407 /DNA_START=519 /DNA_END=1658 /DNA_ORIENTATION=-